MWKAILTLFGLMVLHQMFVVFEGVGYFSENPLTPSIASYSLHVLVTASACYVFYKAYQKDFKEDLRVYKNDGMKAFLVCLKGAAFVLGVNILNSIVFPVAPSENQELINGALTGPYRHLMAIGVVFVGPFLEEVIFRQGLIKDLSRYFNKYVMVILSIVIFAGIHCTTFQDFLAYTPISAAITYCYIKNDKNIAYAFTVHMLYNFLSLLLMYL